MQAEWHTEGRRQPEIIGRDPAGRKLWGGPYTFHQFGLMAILGLAGWILSAPLGSSVRVGLTGGLVLAGYFVGKQVDLSKGNPVFWVTGTARLLTHALLHPQGLSGIPSLMSTSSTMRRPVASHLRVHPILVADPPDREAQPPAGEAEVVDDPVDGPHRADDDSARDHSPLLSNESEEGPSALAQFLAAATRKPTS